MTTRAAVRLTRAWVGLYTRGVTPELRHERRAELESDLWEHVRSGAGDGRRQAATALEIVGRLVAGMPADLAWRSETRRLHRQAQTGGGTSMVTAVKRYGMVALAGALGAWLLAMSVAVWVDPNAPDSAGLKAVLSAVSVAAGVVVLAGVVGRLRGRRHAREQLAAGAIVGGVMSMWAIVPTVVAAAIVVWLYWPRRQPRFAAPA